MEKVFDAIRAAGGRPLIVGGYVRDFILGVPSKDVDVEVYGLEVNELVGILSRFGQVDAVGESFAVLKLHGMNVDWSLPRRENKAGRGHKGFVVSSDPNMSVEEAAARRDYTFNAMALDIDLGQLIDPYGGRDDLKDRVLRHTSEHFVEDPLRVLRGMQFCGRFELTVDYGTAQLCTSLWGEYETLSLDRIWGEWWKWASKSTRPSYGLYFLFDVWWITHYPSLYNLFFTEQDPDWHPEGNVLTHTCLAVDAAAEIARRDGLSEEDTAVLVLSALCHDIGKERTTGVNDGRIVSPGHAEVGAEIARNFLVSIGAPGWVVDQVVPLVREHMAHLNTPNGRSVRRLAHRLGASSVLMLARLIEADHNSRPPLPGGLPENARLMLEIAEAEHVADSVPQPILMGRHLIGLGHEPGPAMGVVLRRAFEAQLDGAFNDLEGALSWVQGGA